MADVRSLAKMGASFCIEKITAGKLFAAVLANKKWEVLSRYAEGYVRYKYSNHGYLLPVLVSPPPHVALQILIICC